MKVIRRSALFRLLAAAAAVAMAAALLPVAALADDEEEEGLVVETLTFRDVLALYASDKDSFGENASETDADGITNAAKRLAEMFTFTVGLNYTGEGLNCNYFGKDITAQMGEEPYTNGSKLASYDVEILPTRSYAAALPKGQTTTIYVYHAGYENTSGGVETVLHYVWQDQGIWYAVKDDNAYYRVSYNGKNARALADDSLALALTHADNGTESIGTWENLTSAADGNGIVTLSDSTLIAGQGSANLLGVTDNYAELSKEPSLSRHLLAVSDFLRGDTTYQTGPLVYKRACYESGTSHRVADGEALREGVSYDFRVQYDEALAVAAGAEEESIGLTVRSELTGECFGVDSFDWLGSAEHLTGDEYNPYTITFTYTPSREGETVCSILPQNLNGEQSALAAAPFHANTDTAAPEGFEETPAPTAEPAATAAPTPLASEDITAPATRGLLAQTLWTMCDSPAADGSVTFTDLPSSAETAQAVCWAAQNGLIVGYGDGTFRPDEAVTREQVAVILCRCAALRGADTTASGDISAWSDGTSVSAWAQESVLWAAQNGVLTADANGAIRAQEIATCGSLSEMLSHLQRL